MRKSVVSILLLALPLLLSYASSKAYVRADGVSGVEEVMRHIDFCSVMDAPLSVIKPANPGHEREIFQVEIREVRGEEDDDETHKVKPLIKGSKYFASLFFARSMESLADTVRGYSPFNRYFFYLSSARYLAFQVFRI